MANFAGAMPVYTLTALNRWSVADKSLPAIDKIKALHVYDFDNTLFNSPLPNPKLWNGPTIGLLQTQDTFAKGGWWHDSRILAATGEGVEKEEPRAWEGWWNEKIVELIHLSMQQKDACTILLTGRSEGAFSDLLKRMLASRGLEADLVVLKPATGPSNQKFTSTMKFKQAFLESLVETYKNAEEIRVYEDRIRHVRDFRDFFTAYNTRQHGNGGIPSSRGPITAEVIQVADGATQLDPVSETAAVQRMINDHNAEISKGVTGRKFQIKKTVFYTGYLINNTDAQKLLTLAQFPTNLPENDMKFLSNNILITPRPCPNSILEKVGGLGNKVTWQIKGTGVFENKIWAASVKPVPETSRYYSENPVPVVVLALRKGARPIDAGKIQNWQPVPQDKAYVFQTTVGEKVLLRIEEQDGRETEYESLFPNKAFKRKHDQDHQGNGSPGGQGPGANSHRGGYQNFNNRGGRGNRGNGGNGNGNGNNGQRGRGRGGGGNGGRGGRGRGGGNGPYHNYRSLDDVGDKRSNQPPPSYEVAYEDFPPLQKQYQTPQQLVAAQFENFNKYQQQQGKGNGGGGKQGGNSGELQYS